VAHVLVYIVIKEFPAHLLSLLISALLPSLASRFFFFAHAALKLVAFEGTFEVLFQIIQKEGSGDGRSDQTIVVLDCLSLLCILLKVGLSIELS
jgi:hypothetical protein